MKQMLIFHGDYFYVESYTAIYILEEKRAWLICCCWSCTQNMILSPVRTLEHLSLAGTQAPRLALAILWHSTATQVIVSRGRGRLCAWEVAAACGVPLCQGVWVRGQLLLFSFLSHVCLVVMFAVVLVRFYMYSALTKSLPLKQESEIQKN